MALNISRAANPYLPTLDLDFTQEYLDSKITFTRNSTATRINSSGVLETVGANVPRFDYDPVTLEPKGLLIEEQRTNLLTSSENLISPWWSFSGAKLQRNLILYSEDFSAANWQISSDILSTNNEAPDGSFSASLIVVNTNLDNDRKTQTISNIQSTVITYSIYVKQYNGLNCGILLYNFTTATSLASKNISFSGLTEGSGVSYAGNGWWRLSITVSSGITIGNAIGAYIYVCNGADKAVGKGCYVWGAQLVEGPDIGTYTKTTTSAVTISYAGPYPGYAAQYVSNIPNLGARYNQSLTLNIGTKYCYTQYVKKVIGSPIVAIEGHDGTTQMAVTFNLDTMTKSGSGVLFDQASIEDIGNGWRKLTAYITPNASGGRLALLYLAAYGASPTASTYAVAAHQLEAGAFPTSYIPTTSAPATRAADVASMTETNFSSWYNASEGTFFSEYSGGRESNQNGYGRVLAYEGSRAFISCNGSSGNSIVFWNGVDTKVRSIAPDNQFTSFVKAAMFYTPTSGGITGQGLSVVTGTTGLSTSPATLYIGTNQNGSNKLNGHIKRIKYYPVRLSNTQLQSLTQ
jgi:hypothetical protein